MTSAKRDASVGAPGDGDRGRASGDGSGGPFPRSHPARLIPSGDTLSPVDVSGVRKTTFGHELRRALRARNQTRPDLVRATGACTTLVKKWIAGESYPDHPTVVLMADHLDWPQLVERSIADRTGTCEACDGPAFTTRGASPPRFCGTRCRRRALDRRRNGRVLTQDRKVLRYRLEEHQDAVRAYCFGCQPEAICRDAECALRPVSPLPFVALTQLRRSA